MVIRVNVVPAVRTLALAFVTVLLLHLVFTFNVSSAPASVPAQCAHEACGIDGSCSADMVNHYCCGSGSDCVTTSCLKSCD